MPAYGINVKKSGGDEMSTISESFGDVCIGCVVVATIILSIITIGTIFWALVP